MFILNVYMQMVTAFSFQFLSSQFFAEVLIWKQYLYI